MRCTNGHTVFGNQWLLEIGNVIQSQKTCKIFVASDDYDEAIDEVHRGILNELFKLINEVAHKSIKLSILTLEHLSMPGMSDR